MRVVDMYLKTIPEYDLSKGKLVPVRAIKEDATPIDNVKKWAWDESDYEDVLMYLETVEEDVGGYVSPEMVEIQAVESQLSEIKSVLDGLVEAIKKLPIGEVLK